MLRWVPTYGLWLPRAYSAVALECEGHEMIILVSQQEGDRTL